MMKTPRNPVGYNPLGRGKWTIASPPEQTYPTKQMGGDNYKIYQDNVIIHCHFIIFQQLCCFISSPARVEMTCMTHRYYRVRQYKFLGLAMTSNIISSHISKKLRNMRNDRGWSLDATSKETSVSKAMLGQIERGESSPTINTLWKLATGFGVSFSSFMLNESTETKQPEKILSRDKNMEIKTIFPVNDDVQLEVFQITISGPTEQISESHPQKAIEHVIVLDGEMNVFFDDEWHLLQSGDSIRFSANQTRGYAAVSPTAVFHNIISYSS